MKRDTKVNDNKDQ